MAGGLKDCDNLNYAWNWFSYHAHQRLLCFHFFIIILGGTGYFLASKFSLICSIIVGLFLIFIARLFWILEIRNRELVNCGRLSLNSIAKDGFVNPRVIDEQRELLSKTIEKDKFLPKWMMRLSKEKIRHTYVYDELYRWTGYLGWLLLLSSIVVTLVVNLEKVKCIFKCLVG